jgi:hypothetical protein
MKPFDVCWERIKRAQTHRHAIVNIWNAFLEEEPYGTGSEVSGDGTGRIWIEQLAPVPTGIAFELGEYLYQLRAALDACIYEAACVNTGLRPPPDEDRLAFPFCLRPENFTNKRSRVQMGPLTDKQRFYVQSAQPYAAPADLTERELTFNFNRCLSILNDWARKDRHRKLHVIASWASNVNPLIRFPDGARLAEFTVLQNHFILKDQTDIATFRIDGWRHGMQMQTNPNLTLDLTVDEIPPPGHDIDTLNQRSDCMERGVAAVVGHIAGASDHPL